MALYCDLDGVLADFEGEIKKITGKYPDELLDRSDVYRIMTITPRFFRYLSWTDDGEELWSNISYLYPIILTARATSVRTCIEDKVDWCAEKLGPEIPIKIVNSTMDKIHHCLPGDILIDDRIKLQEGWINRGGVFLHYQNNRLETLERLCEYIV